MAIRFFLTVAQNSWVSLPPWSPMIMYLNAMSPQRKAINPMQYLKQFIKQFEIALEPLIFTTLNTLIRKMLGQAKKCNINCLNSLFLHNIKSNPIKTSVWKKCYP
jgi:hypothetical protein